MNNNIYKGRAPNCLGLDKFEHIHSKNSVFINLMNDKFINFNYLNKLSPKGFSVLFDNQKSTFEQHSKFKNGAKFY